MVFKKIYKKEVNKMEIDVGDLTAPSHKIGGGGSGRSKAIEEFMTSKFDAGEKVCDTEIAEALNVDIKEKGVIQNIRNHTNIMRKAGKISWLGNVPKGKEFEGDHVYSNEKDAYYFDEDGNLKEEFKK